MVKATRFSYYTGMGCLALNILLKECMPSSEMSYQLHYTA